MTTSKRLTKFCVLVGVGLASAIVGYQSRADRSTAERVERTEGDGARDARNVPKVTRHPRSSPVRMSANQVGTQRRADPVQRASLGLRAKEVFASEKRDETWAVPVETFLRTEVEAAFEVLLPEATNVQVECRESSCELSFHVAPELTDAAFGLQQTLPLAELMEPWSDETLSDDGTRRIGMVLLFGSQWRPEATIRERWERAMAKRPPKTHEAYRAYIFEELGIEP